MSYFFDSMKDNYDIDLISSLMEYYYGNNPIITSEMVISFSQIELFKNALKIVHSQNIFKIKNVMGYVSYNGPCGKISWNNEGLSNTFIKLGIV